MNQETAALTGGEGESVGAPWQDAHPALGAKREMTDAEVAAFLRDWVKHDSPRRFSWPTDGCGYHQHLRFVHHRNASWQGGDVAAWKQFILDYVSSSLDLPTPPEPVEFCAEELDESDATGRAA